MPTEKILKEFYFKAMLRGWAADAQARRVPGMVRHKEFTYQDGDLLLIDQYWTHPDSRKSAGVTKILFDGIVVWSMSYQGEYEEEAIPFLKLALRLAYKAEVFVGGRGVCGTGQGSLRYVNTGNKLEDFSHFSGMEYVEDMATERRLGWHEYHGMSLIDLKD